jgi:putative transposase
MLIAHRIALDPNNVQATYLAKAAGVARFAYNWALAEWKRQFDAHKANPALPKPSQMALRRQLNAIKREQFPWMLDVTKCAPQMAIIQLGQAFANFFAGRARYPQFRKKGRDDRFTLTNDQFDIDGCRIRIPNLGWMRMRESLRFTGKIMSATISRVADRWFVSITVDTPDSSHLPQAENQGAVGVDFGCLGAGNALDGRNDPWPQAPQGAALPLAQAVKEPVAQAKGIGQPPQGQGEARKVARSHRRDPAGRPAQAHDRPHAALSHHRHRGSERARHDGEPASGPVDCRHELL